ncbi:MAG: hypothetical protein PF484_01470 [Bacteroidales bacterium]|jgi:hypothetical protein|nr:hypothetical protein [Bacteroidales bacterium]
MKGESKTEKIASIIITLGLIIYLPYDFSKYYSVLKENNYVEGKIIQKELHGTARNKKWVLKYEYTVEKKLFKKTLLDVTPFSNTYKKDMDLYVYYAMSNPKKSLALTTVLEKDFKPNLKHYLTLDRPSIFYLKIIAIIILIRLIPISLILIYTLFGGLFLYVFNRLEYYDFIENRKNDIWNKNKK